MRPRGRSFRLRPRRRLRVPPEMHPGLGESVANPDQSTLLGRCATEIRVERPGSALLSIIQSAKTTRFPEGRSCSSNASPNDGPKSCAEAGPRGPPSSGSMANREGERTSLPLPCITTRASSRSTSTCSITAFPCGRSGGGARSFASMDGKTSGSSRSLRSCTTRCWNSFRNCGTPAALSRTTADSCFTSATLSACTSHAKRIAGSTSPSGPNGPTRAQNFLSLLAETQEILEAQEILKKRHPCLLLSHEFFCCDHERALPRLHEFLGIEPLPPCQPRDFLRRCGRCGQAFTVAAEQGQEWLVCPRHRRRVSGCGRFNPLAETDSQGVLDDSWKTTPHIDRMMSDVRRLLGDAVADYFWDGNYVENLLTRRAVSNAA